MKETTAGKTNDGKERDAHPPLLTVNPAIHFDKVNRLLEREFWFLYNIQQCTSNEWQDVKLGQLFYSYLLTYCMLRFFVDIHTVSKSQYKIQRGWFLYIFLHEILSLFQVGLAVSHLLYYPSASGRHRATLAFIWCHIHSLLTLYWVSTNSFGEIIWLFHC